jgi:uncharacterized protein (DUF488 family)
MEFCESLRLVASWVQIMSTTISEVFTIGHSTHSWERFIALLRSAHVTAIADVRTSPYSRHSPQFSRDSLRAELRSDGISYVFLGKELGGRPSGRQFYCDGVADYEKMAHTPEFSNGLDRVLEGTKKYRIALMCSERDPLDCHRCLLVGRALAQRGVRVNHILDDGNVASHGEIEDTLLRLSGRDAADLFAAPLERLATAYRERARKVAFAEPQPSLGSVAAE